MNKTYEGYIFKATTLSMWDNFHYNERYHYMLPPKKIYGENSSMESLMPNIEYLVN